jgi:hypothetical protein
MNRIMGLPECLCVSTLVDDKSVAAVFTFRMRIFFLLMLTIAAPPRVLDTAATLFGLFRFFFVLVQAAAVKSWKNPAGWHPRVR